MEHEVGQSPTDEMVIAGFECAAFEALDATYRTGNGPSCKQAADAVRGIFLAMVAAKSK